MIEAGSITKWTPPPLHWTSNAKSRKNRDFPRYNYLIVVFYNESHILSLHFEAFFLNHPVPTSQFSQMYPDGA